MNDIMRYFDHCITYAPGAFLVGMLTTMIATTIAIVIMMGVNNDSAPICEQPVNVLHFNNERYVRQP